MPVSTGVAAALAAPLLEAVGFLEWDIHWSKHGGSAFALNLYKCNFASFFFFCMVILENNLPYMQATIQTNQLANTMWGESAPGNQNFDEQGYVGKEVVHNTNVMQNGGGDDVSVIHLTTPNDAIGHLPNGQSNGIEQPWQHHPDIFPQQQQDMAINSPNIQMQQVGQAQPPSQVDQMNVIQQQLMNANNRNLQETNQQYGDIQSPSNSDYNNYEVTNLPETYHHPFEGYYEKLPFLILSSFLGIIIGDLAELEALRLIGARRILMVYTIKPFAAAFLGNVLLNEPIYVAAFFGMILTALGVYVVLMASFEKLEKNRRKHHRGSSKRKSESFFFSSDNDKSFDTGSIGSFNEDEEIAGILNKDMSNDIYYDHAGDNFRMIGMRRRPLSRHDLTSDFFDDTDYVEDDAFLMMTEASGEGVIDTTISCMKVSSSSGSYGNSSDGWDDLSEANQSFDSMNSLEKLDVDVMVAMENFDNSEEDEEDDDMDLHFSLTDKRSPQNNPYLETNTSNSPEQNERITLSTTSPDKPALKSALRQSKYGGQSASTSSNSNDTEIASPFTKKVFEKLPPIIKKRDPFKKNRVLRRSSKSTDSLGSVSSMGSMASFESECGPPPGMYDHSRKESKLERKVRIRTGYVLATFNVILDAYCSYLTKKHGVGLSTWEINLSRLGFAGLTLSLIATLMKQRERRLKGKLQRDQPDYQTAYFGPSSPSEIVDGGLSNIAADSKVKFRPWYRLPKMSAYPWFIVSIGVFFVTFLSPALASYSLFEIPLALSISLTSITPLFTIPLGIFRKGDKPTLRGYVGAALSVLGVMILCIWGVDSAVPP